jgi:5'-3' exonuclease
MKKLLLLDGDIIAFKYASRVEVEDELDDNFTLLWSDPALALKQAVEDIERQKKLLKADLVFFTHTSKTNWRKDVLSSYKDNRKSVRKPIALQKLKESLAKLYRGVLWDTFEADDVMGILATDPEFYPEYRKIISSEDKDMKTIPCHLYNPAKDVKEKLVTQEAADSFFYTQAFAGDAVDGFGGCPSIGMDTAAKLLETLTGVVAAEHTFKSGAKKGTTETRWSKTPMDCPWEVIVSHYAKAGLSEDYALQQARCARICRVTEFNQVTKRVKLWNF